MGTRLRALSAGLVCFVALVAVAVPRVASGQSAPTWKAPRTPDGQPDLQGVWLSKSATPLERPKALEGRTLLTDAEVAQLQARAGSLFKDGNSDFTAGDAVFLAALGTADRFKSTTSTHNSEDMIEREFDRHTSLIVDPPDGRIPASTADALKRREAAAAAPRVNPRNGVRARGHLRPVPAPAVPARCRRRPPTASTAIRCGAHRDGDAGWHCD